MKPYEKQLWIELIGFDCLAPDYGVKEFLARMEKKPARISLLLWSADIIHAHAGLETDFPLGPQQCSYYARPYNEERRRQFTVIWMLFICSTGDMEWDVQSRLITDKRSARSYRPYPSQMKRKRM